MAQKLALVLAVLAVSCIAINAATTASPSSNFNVTPALVADNSTDTNFINYTGAIFVPGFDNTTVFVYGYNYSASDASISLVRRAINASTIAAINSTDSKISTTIPTNSTPVGSSGLGYLGFVVVYNSSASTYPDVSLYYTAVNGSVSSVKITSNSDYNISYSLSSTWFESNYFYVTYVEKNITSGVDQAAYIQGVLATDGSKLFSSPVKVASLNETAGSSFVMAGPTNKTNSSTINVLYRTNIANSTYTVTLTINGSTVSSPVTLFTDSGNVTYRPSGTSSSFSTSGVFVKKMDASTSPQTNSTYGFYNGNTTAVLVAGSSMSGYAAPSVSGMHYVDGFYLYEIYPSVTGGDTAYYLDFYFSNLTRNGSAQVSLGTFGAGFQPFVDANGAFWGGYITKETWLMKAYLGKILGQVNAGASVLGSFLAFISLMIAALFAF